MPSNASREKSRPETMSKLPHLMMSEVRSYATGVGAASVVSVVSVVSDPRLFKATASVSDSNEACDRGGMIGAAGLKRGAQSGSDGQMGKS